MAQWVRALAAQAEGCMGIQIPLATDLIRKKKTGSDSSTAKRSAKGVCVTGPRK